MAGTPKRNLDTFARLGGKKTTSMRQDFEVARQVLLVSLIPRYNSMISACERCSLWEEAVNVLCMLLASSIFHAFSMPIASSFFTVITVSGELRKRLCLYFPLQVGGGSRWQG